MVKRAKVHGRGKSFIQDFNRNHEMDLRRGQWPPDLLSTDELGRKKKVKK